MRLAGQIIPSRAAAALLVALAVNPCGGWMETAEGAVGPAPEWELATDTSEVVIADHDSEEVPVWPTIGRRTPFRSIADRGAR